MFRRKLKYNSESFESAQTNNIPSISKSPHVFENVLLANNCSNIKINDNRYKTRTSSAGTLVIREETFNNSYRRRRRRDASIENSNNAQNNAGPHLKNTIGNRERGGLHARHVSDPGNSTGKILNVGDHQREMREKFSSKSKKDITNL